MKLSLDWILDHIAVDKHAVDIHDVVKRFNKTTAEIESYHQVQIDTHALALAEVVSVNQETMNLVCPEWNVRLALPARTDLSVGARALIYKHAHDYSWAELTHCGGQKHGIMPAISCDPKLMDGSWKKHIIHNDWIIVVDNKSINHRPDLWSHEGIAREIAAMYELPFTEAHIDTRIQYIRESSKCSSRFGDIAVTVSTPGNCKRYCAAVTSVTSQPSTLFLAFRLAKIDSKPINAIVDLTNYVMFDIGQPMHAFDADTLAGNHVEVRTARKGESITLLDGQLVTLDTSALVIADDTHPIALAGVMGGQATRVTLKSARLFLESATFDAPGVRKTAALAKVRTDASARFEKTLDPENAPRALARFFKLAHDAQLIADEHHTILVLGAQEQPVRISFDIAQLYALVGIEIPRSSIEKTLTALGFTVTFSDSRIDVIVPSYRSSKDIAIAQDIIEEVVRFYGYESIPTQLPKRYMAPFGMSALLKIRSMKQLLAHGIGMQEVYNYSLFDQSFIDALNYTPTNTAHVMSPVSANWKQLVTTLIPGLLKNVVDNAALHDRLRFFEWARVWNLEDGQIHEHKKIAGIMYAKYEEIDFYWAKEQLIKLFASFKQTVDWKQLDYSIDPWWMPFQTARLYYAGKCIGVAGKIQKSLLHKHVLGDAFIFEIDGNFLLESMAGQDNFKPLAKHQPTKRDMSMLVPLSATVDQLKQALLDAHECIVAVSLKDIFYKQEWGTKKSITFEYTISDPHATLSREASDHIASVAQRAVVALGAEIR